MGIFEPSVNLEKEQKMLAKYNPYDGLTAAVKVTHYPKEPISAGTKRCGYLPRKYG